MLTPQTIHAGATPLASTLVVEQPGPWQLTVRAGTFVTTDGETLVYAGDLPYVLSSDPTLDKTYTIEVGTLNGTADLLCRSQLTGEALPDAPAGWVTAQWLVWGIVPAGAPSLDALDFRVFTVLPGFPAGTVAADWQAQSGVVHAAD